LIVESDLLADNTFKAAKPALPKIVTDYRNRLTSLTLFVNLKIAAAKRSHFQQRKEVRCYAHPLDPLDVAISNEADCVSLVRGNVFETPIASAPVLQVEIRDAALNSLSDWSLPDGDNPVGVSECRRIEYQSIDDTEDCGDRADAERQSYHRDDSETGILRQHSQGLTQVLPE